jgi:hypothetical protein
LFYNFEGNDGRTTVVLNKGGLIACAVYSAHFAVFFGWAMSADLETSAFLAAVAVFPAGLLLAGLGLLLGTHDFPFSVDSWLNSMLAYYIGSLIIVYLIGWSASSRSSMSARRRERLSEDVSD